MQRLDRVFPLISFTEKKSRELSYPILEKVIMWVNIQCKVSLKTKGDYGKSIIYTAKRNWLKDLGIYTNKEFFKNQKRTCGDPFIIINVQMHISI
jgi:hypothetical protein